MTTEHKPHSRPSADRLQALRDYYLAPGDNWVDGSGDIADLFAEIDGLVEQVQSLERDYEEVHEENLRLSEAYVGLKEQYENAMKLALKGQTREAEIMRLKEQLEAALRERNEWAAKCQMLVEAVEAFQEASSPASEPKEDA